MLTTLIFLYREYSVNGSITRREWINLFSDWDTTYDRRRMTYDCISIIWGERFSSRDLATKNPVTKDS